VTNRVTIGTHMDGRRWTLADVHQEVKRDMHQLKELPTWLRDEEAAGSNPATPTRSKVTPPPGRGLFLTHTAAKYSNR
jgi:hypothetical protein